MSVHPFFTFIQNYVAISEKEWELVRQRIEHTMHVSGDILLREGQVCKKLYFLESGLMRYYISKDGEELNKFFTKPPYLFTSQQSFGLQTPANESIQALQDSSVWQVTKKQADELMQHKFWRTFAELIRLEVQGFTELILEQIQGSTAEERYIWMLENEKELVLDLPLKHLASYLGIAPQSLSRIRKRMWNTKKWL